MRPTDRRKALALALMAAAVVAIVSPLFALVTGDAEQTTTLPAPRTEAKPPDRLGRLPVAGRSSRPETVVPVRAPDAPAPAAGSLTPMEESRQEELLWRERLARFDAQPVDLAWGASVKERLLPVLDPLVDELSGRVLDLECRSSQCKATIDWKDGKVPTMEDGTRLMLDTVPATRGCARHVRLADPHNRDATTLIFECG